MGKKSNRSRKQGSGQTPITLIPPPEEEASIEELLAHGRAMFRRSKYKKAKAVYEALIAKWPGRSVGYLWLDDLFINIGKPARGLKLYRKTYQRFPMDCVVANDYATSLHQCGKLNQARRVFLGAIGFCKSDPVFLFNYANTLQDLGRLSECGIIYRDLLRIDGDDLEVMFNYAYFLLESGTHYSARNLYHQVVERASELIRIEESETVDSRETPAHTTSGCECPWRPYIAIAQNNLGRCYSHAGEFDEAILWYDRAMETDPEYRLPLYNRAVTLRRLGRFSESVADFEKYLEHCPGDADAKWNMKVMRRMMHSES